MAADAINRYGKTAGQELGLFAYGGSTVVTLFQRGAVEFDKDLKARSRTGVETLVHLGTSLARTAGWRESLISAEE